MDGSEVDYRALNEFLYTQLNPLQAQNTYGRKIAIPNATLYPDGKLYFIAYTGFTSSSELFFDLNTNQEIVEAADPRRFKARKTHVMIDPESRHMLVEEKRGTVDANDVMRMFELASNHVESLFQTLELDAAPLPSADFVGEIETLTRIQGARAVLTKPNPGWTDNYDGLSAMADDSDARRIEVSASARKGKSLNKSNGIVQLIKHYANSTVAGLKEVAISGSRSEDGGLTTLKLNDHVASETLSTGVDQRGQPLDEELQTRMGEAMDARRPAQIN